MRNLIRSLVAAALLACSTNALYATDSIVVDPAIERGVAPGKAYQVGDIDTINLFNGNLNLRIPLGQAYSAGGHLNYALALHYSGNAWEMGERIIDVQDPFYGTW